VVSKPRSLSTAPIVWAISPVAPYLVAADTKTLITRSFRGWLDQVVIVSYHRLGVESTASWPLAGCRMCPR
jgi:hypothetical protein